jgi:NAD(P)-dependent dehydrogenase (short-subunit alcohol dehydrogenase family)
MGRFDGHVAVVTGGSSGIGLATAKRLYQEGARVAIAGRDEQRLHEAAGSIGDDVFAVPADVAKPEEIDLLFSTVARALGRIDVLFVNAGLKRFQALPDTTEGFFDEVSDVNTKGAFFTLQKQSRTSTTEPPSSCAAWRRSTRPGAAREPSCTPHPRLPCGHSPVLRRQNSHGAGSG